MWKNGFSRIFQKDPHFQGEEGKRLLKLLEELHKTPEGRGMKKQGKELKIFYDFLSRCRVSPPDPKTGKCKWSYVGEPAEKIDFGHPDIFTLEMAKEFADTKEEVDSAAEDIEKLIDKGVLEGEELPRNVLKRRLEKQRRKILLSKMEQLRKKRLSKNWRKLCIRNDKSVFLAQRGGTLGECVKEMAEEEQEEDTFQQDEAAEEEEVEVEN